MSYKDNQKDPYRKDRILARRMKTADVTKEPTGKYIPAGRLKNVK